MLSRQFCGSGCWPVLGTVERRMVHSATISFFRAAVSEKWSDHSWEQGDASGHPTDLAEPHFLGDEHLLRIYHLRAPYAYVRMSRLRLCIRVVSKAPIHLLFLMMSAKSDSKYWLTALEDDVAWMGRVDPDASMTMSEFFQLCRNDPKKARRIIRKACDSMMAQSLTIMETKPAIIALRRTWTCHCGSSFKTKANLGLHQFRKHGKLPPWSFYASNEALCRCCMLQFSARNALLLHFKNSPLCILNIILREEPLTVELEVEARRLAQEEKLSRIRAGYCQHFTEVPCFRVCGPVYPLVSLDGEWILPSNRKHPRGPGSRQYIPADEYALIGGDDLLDGDFGPLADDPLPLDVLIRVIGCKFLHYGVPPREFDGH